jgi:hypothetical protein
MYQRAESLKADVLDAHCVKATMRLQAWAASYHLVKFVLLTQKRARIMRERQSKVTVQRTPDNEPLLSC